MVEHNTDKVGIVVRVHLELQNNKCLCTMIIKNRKANVYDIEIFPNCFHCTIYDTEDNKFTFLEISERKNQLDELYQFFDKDDIILVGYNNHHYDDVIINYIIDYYYKMKKLNYISICKSLFNLSRVIINSEEGNIDSWKRWKYAHYFKSMDLLTMLFSSKLRVGLKEMQVTMHFRNVQEYTGEFGNDIPVDKIKEMISYNINDVESTTELLNRVRKDIDLRLFIEEEYGFECLSMDSVKFGETLLAKLYCEKTGIDKKTLEQMRSPMDYIALKDAILPFIHYEDKILVDALKDMKKQVVSTKERKSYDYKFLYNGVQFSIGVGGIHTINKPDIFIPEEDEYIGHSDVNSLYPSMIVSHELEPRHLGKPFLYIYENVLNERLEAKHSGKKLKNLALKLTLNSVTGKMQQETSWMYDPFSVFKIRINGQLILLMLIERLVHLDCKIIQGNTDGVMYLAKKKDRKKIKEAIEEIERITKLTFETDEFLSFYQYSVNYYFGVVDETTIEKKGMFGTSVSLGKGLSPSIIPKAVINYFVNGTSIRETIRNCTDIKDFLMAQRVKKTFKVEYGGKDIQRINRFYASTNGNYLYKYKTVDGVRGYTNLLTKSGVTILNKLDDKPISERKINYQYYESEAAKIIEEFTVKQLSLW